jgi:hypothetical protein
MSMTTSAAAATAPAPLPTSRALARRAGWGLVDQALSASTNVAVFIVVAHQVDLRGLDSFAVAFFVFTLLIGMERALVGQIFGVRYSGTHGAPWRRAAGEGLGAVLVGSSAASLLMLLVAVTLPSPLRQTLMAAAAVMPFLVLQDACRMAFFSQGQPHRAALNDFVWAVVQLGATVLLLAQGKGEAPDLVAVWGLSAGVATVLALVQLRVLPNPAGAGAWIGGTWSVSAFLLAEYLLGAGAFNGGFLAVGALVDDGALASIRGAQVLLGPLFILNAAVLTFSLPEVARRTTMSRRRRRQVALSITVGMLVISLAYTALLLTVPDSVGTWLFRDDWSLARAVLLPVALGTAAAGAAAGPAVVIYGMAMTRQAIRVMYVEAPLVFALLIGGALVGGVVGAAWGLAIDQLLMLPMWYLVLRRCLDRPAAALPDRQAVPQRPAAA